MYLRNKACVSKGFHATFKTQGGRFLTNHENMTHRSLTPPLRRMEQAHFWLQKKRNKISGSANHKLVMVTAQETMAPTCAESRPMAPMPSQWLQRMPSPQKAPLSASPLVRGSLICAGSPPGRTALQSTRQGGGLGGLCPSPH